MNAARADKEAVRSLWVERVREYDGRTGATDEPVPLYLTLCGAEGRDVRELAENGLLQLTQTGGIAPEHQSRVIAVESSQLAAAELQGRFPGLKIVSEPFQNLVRGQGPVAFPETRLRRLCRALVINLDFNSSLNAEVDSRGQVDFPALIWIRKLAQMHAQSPRIDWCLCLTVQGELQWPKAATVAASALLTENMQHEEDFAEQCRKFLNDSLFDRISAGAVPEFDTLHPEHHQQFLMTFVPKKIAQMAHADGWRVQTHRNLRYGGDGVAPMVTWIFEFMWDSRIASTPRTVYRESILTIFDGAGEIRPDGTILLANES